MASVPSRSAVRCERTHHVGLHGDEEATSVIGGNVLTHGVEQRGAGPQPGQRPEVVPVERVERAQVLDRVPRREQTRQTVVAQAGSGAPLVLDPLHGPGDGRFEAFEHRVVTAELPVMGHRPQRSAVGVPLVAAAEESVRCLAIGVAVENRADLVVEPVPVERRQLEGRLTEPEPVMRGRAGRDALAVVKQQLIRLVCVDRLLKPLVGHHEAGAALDLGRPPRSHLLGPRDRGRVTRGHLHPAARQR